MHTVRSELISTRLYLFLLFLSVLTIIFYTILLLETVKRQTSIPSQNQYEQLLAEHSYRLRCPCSNISLAHKEFMTVNTTFHQVCSSDFMNNTWIQLFTAGNAWFSYDRSDVRVVGGSFYGFLSRLCTLSQSTVNKATDEFLAEVFVSAQAISELDFLSQMNVSIQKFKTTTPTRFAHTLQLLRDISQANAFVSGFFLNWHWSLKNDQSSATIPTYPVTMKNQCSCATRNDCFESGSFYDGLGGTVLYTIPGLNVGCSIVETLLRSTFECLYDRACIAHTVKHIKQLPDTFNGSIGYMPMNSTIMSRFSTHTTIGDVVDALFIEKWHINVSYAAFYRQCAPSYCSYTDQQRHNFLYVISRLLGLYGGLTVSLHLIVPYMVKLLFNIKNHFCTNTIAPVA